MRRGFALAVALLAGCSAGADALPVVSTTATTTTAPPPPPTTTTFTAPPRPVVEQAHTPFAVVGELTLVHPSTAVERVGFHEAAHDGAQQQLALDTAAAPVTLETRERGTGSQTAADVVIDPDRPVVAPVTGTVIRGGNYILYCDTPDEYAVIEPDARPGWEVKILHVVGLQVSVGDRVVAGETVVAERPHVLPFPSQVEELGHKPPWPHVHIEVVDPSIPDRPTPGGGC